MQDIIQLLKNDKEYYAGIGKQYLSNSDIGVLLANPKDYGKSREDNKAFAEGRYFHQSILEPEKAAAVVYVDASSRNTNKYKEFCLEKGLDFCLLKKEVEDIDGLVATMKGNIDFYDYIYCDGYEYEQPAVKEIKGTWWKGKADILCDHWVIDLKTTSDINKFKYSAKSYNYDSQCYLYQTLFGRPPIFLVIDKISGQLGMFKPTDSFVAGGEQKVERALEVYNKYFGNNPTDNIANYYIHGVLE